MAFIVVFWLYLNGWCSGDVEGVILNLSLRGTKQPRTSKAALHSSRLPRSFLARNDMVFYTGPITSPPKK
jgi:hypothetical protein